MIYKIVADSSCDLNKELEKDMEVKLVPFKINIDDENFIDDKSLNVKDLIKSMKQSPNPIRTSCPTPYDFANEYRHGDSIFVVTISEQLSGTYNSAMLAKKMIQEEFPEKFVHVFNSKSASVGETLVAMKINELIKEKLSNLEIVEKVEKFIDEMKTYFISENLDNLIKNGRISKTQGLIANVLNIKPIMGATDDGNIEAIEKVRGTKRAFKRLVEIIGEKGEKFGDKILAISHADALQRALDLKEELMKYNFKDIIIVETKGLSTAYVNHKGIILAF